MFIEDVNTACRANLTLGENKSIIDCGAAVVSV